jgi:membrane-associated protein
MLDLLQQALDFLRHLPEQLEILVRDHGLWAYGILAAIIFVETGLVIMPFLPGDSLLFACGAVAAIGKLNPWVLGLILIAAAILGNIVNYSLGRMLGPRILRGESFRLLSRKHLDRAHAFFEKYGAKAVILSRFVPIVRTFVPFAAGIGAMNPAKFMLHNTIGAVAWVGVCMGAGYVFGNVKAVRDNFELVVVGIVFVSMLPMVVEFVIARRRAAASASPKEPAPGA